MSVKNFIPEIWAAEIERALYANAIFGQAPITNRNYEKDLNLGGDTVRINQLGKISVSDYSGSVSYAELDDAQTVLHLNQKKYAAVKLDDIDKIQSRSDLMPAAADEMSAALIDAMEQYIASLYTQAGVSSSGTGVTGGAVAVTSSTAQAYLEAVAGIMGDAKIPDQNRWMVVPEWLYYRIVTGLGNQLTENVSALTGGVVKMAYGFELYKSANVNNDGTNWNIMAGRPVSITLAQQIRNVEALRDQDAFNDLLRALHVYGAKVVRPDQLFYGVVKKS